MDYIINYFIISIPKFYITILFSISLLGYKLPGYKYKIFYMSAIIALVMDFLVNLNVDYSLRYLLTITSIYILYLVIIRSKWFLSLFMSLISVIVLTTTKFLMGIFLDQFIGYSLNLEEFARDFLVTFIEFSPIVLMIYIMNKKNLNFSKSINKIVDNKISEYWVKIIFLITFQTYIVLYLNYTIYMKNYMILFKVIPLSYYILILSSSIIIINIFLVKVFINLKNKYADIEVSKTESNYNDNLEKLLANLRMERHDNISQVQALYGMVTERKYNMLEEYLTDIVENIKASPINHSICIKNVPVSALIHTKIENLNSKGIDFKPVVETTDIFKEIKGADLVKIVSNILDNAIRAVSDSNIKNPAIKLYWGKENNNAVISISNNGQKINKNTINLIFKEGYSTKENMENSGYGLAVVKSIVSKYKGSIDVKSTKEITSFTVKIPLDNKNKKIDGS
ncbi:MAG: sensor histidine kinase [Vulcanibacillus sp.]